jgi:alpha-mannosidase
MNQFAGVLRSAAEGISAAMNTDGRGVPLVIFNPLNIARQDLV